MMSETDDEIRKRIELRYEKRQDLFKKLAGFVAINVILWLIFHESWVFWVTLVMGIGVVSNIVEYYSKYGGGAERREVEIQREIERERERGLTYEKPKNDTRMRLTDDGELEEVPDDEDYTAEKPKRQS
jgi:hypothetical protein